MSISFTLATLKTALEGHVEDSGTDFTGAENTLIQRAEERLIRDLNLEIFKVTGSITITQSSRLLTKPAGFLRLDTLYYTLAAAAVTFLEEKTYEACLDYAPIVATETTPKYWAELNDTQLYIAGTPNAAVAAVGGTIRYLKKPTSLVTNTNGTWLSQNVGDLLLEAALLSADEYNLELGANSLRVGRQAEYDTLLAGALRQFRHLASRDYAPIAATPNAREER